MHRFALRALERLEGRIENRINADVVAVVDAAFSQTVNLADAITEKTGQ